MLLDLLRLSRAVGEASSGKLSGKLLQWSMAGYTKRWIDWIVWIGADAEAEQA